MKKESYNDKLVAKAKVALLSMQRHSWEQGVAMQAFYESGDYEPVITMAIESAYRSMDDGRIAAIGTMEAATDPCAVGEGLLFAINHLRGVGAHDQNDQRDNQSHNDIRSNSNIYTHNRGAQDVPTLGTSTQDVHTFNAIPQDEYISNSSTQNTQQFPSIISNANSQNAQIYNELQSANNNLLEWALHKAPRNADGIVYHMVDTKEFWVDSLYMLPPFLAVNGYYEEAMQQLDGYWDKLYNPEKQLLSHRWDDENDIFIREDFWGVGNGWAMAALCRLIDLFPSNLDSLIDRATRLITSVSKYIREDGLAHDVLDDPTTFVDVNLPQMLSYSIYRGINSGWLGNEFLAIADKCRRAAEDHIDRYGFVRDVCGAPHFVSPGIAPEGQAFFIMMECQVNEQT
jgi:rhamnogalacturonyl hydrolase YesR